MATRPQLNIRGDQEILQNSWHRCISELVSTKIYQEVQDRLGSVVMRIIQRSRTNDEITTYSTSEGAKRRHVPMAIPIPNPWERSSYKRL